MLNHLKLIIVLIVLCTLLASCNTKEALTENDLLFIDRYYTSYGNDEFDHNNIVLTFSAMSDIHIGGDGQDIKLSNALNILNKRAKFGIDAFLFAGDLTNTSGHYQDPKEISKFRDIVKKHLGKDTAVVYCLGVNHDHLSEGIEAQRELFEKTFGSRFYSKDILDAATRYSGLRHSVISGYNFISIDYDIDGYMDEKLKWVEDTLTRLTDEEPEKPVFVTVHIPPSGKLYSVLNKFPQVINFSGHTHIPMNTDKNIKQDNFTQLHCGGMFYYRQFTRDNDTIGEMGNIYDFAQGYLVEVDKDNNVRVIRMDFNNQSYYSPEWIIGRPKEDKSHLKYRDLMKDATKPYFAESAKISFDDSLTYTLVGKFDRAVNGSNPVEYYEINFWSRVKGEIKHEVKYISSRYPLFDINSLPESYDFTFFRDDGEYAISVTAYDCFNSSNSIFFNGGMFCTVINTEGGEAGIYINGEKTRSASFLPGDSVTIRVSPPSGYRYEVIVDNVTLSNNTFTMPNDNVEILVKLTKG